MFSRLCEIAQCSEVFDDVTEIINHQLRVESKYSQQLLRYHPADSEQKIMGRGTSL